MKIVEIKESNVSSEYKYAASNYPKSGLYFNTDENGLAELVDVNRYTGVTGTIFTNNLDHIPEYKPKEVETTKPKVESGNVSEEMALKMLHVALHGDKSNIKDI